MKLLIAYDGSETSRATLSDLRSAGLPAETEVLVLSVVDAWLPPETVEDSRADEALPGIKGMRERVRSAVEKQRAVAESGADVLRSDFPTWRIAWEACADSPAWAIIKRAEGFDGGVAGKPADMVVVGSHGYGAIKRLVLGSIAQQVVRHVRCSVRICRTSVALSSEVSVPRLIIGVDGSPDSRAAVEAVASRSWPAGTRMLVATFEASASTVTSGWEPGIIWGSDPLLSVPATGSDQSAARIAEEAAEFLRERCSDMTVTTLVKAGDPKYGLMEAAESWEGAKANCIFVGATGVRGIERFFLGSVSASVAMNAGCSVEIVRRRASVANLSPG